MKTSTPQPPSTSRGFTLIEMMTTVAIVGIFAALAINGLQKITPRFRSTRSMDRFVSALRLAPRLAISNGAHVWLGIENPAFASNSAPYRFFLYEDWNDNFDPASFDPNAPTALIDQETGSGRRYDKIRAMGPLEGVSFPPAPSLQATTLAKLPGAVSTALASASLGCTTCPTNSRLVWLHYDPSGEVEVVTTPPQTTPPSFLALILGVDNQDIDGNRRVVFVSLPFGLVEVLDDA